MFRLVYRITAVKRVQQFDTEQAGMAAIAHEGEQGRMVVRASRGERVDVLTAAVSTEQQRENRLRQLDSAVPFRSGFIPFFSILFYTFTQILELTKAKRKRRRKRIPLFLSANSTKFST